MIEINDELVSSLLDKAAACERKRMNYDLRTSADDGSQRMLNALLPGTAVPVHRHPMSNETVLCLKGRLEEVIFEEVQAPRDLPSGELPKRGFKAGKVLREVARYMLDPSSRNFGCVVPAGAWHTVEVLEPSIILEAKDGRFGEDGSVGWEG